MPWRDVISFGLGALVLVAGAYVVSELLDPIYPEAATRMRILEERAESIEAVSLGNSHAVAIDFKVLGLNGIHLNRGGSDLFEAAYYGRYASAHLPALRYVLLNVSYGTLELDNSRGRGNLSIRKEMYARTRSRSWIAGDRDLFIGAKIAPVARPDHWIRPIGKLLGLPVREVIVGADGSTFREQQPILSHDSLYQLGIETAHGMERAMSELAVPVEETRLRSAAEVAAFVEEMADRGVQTILYTAPVYHTYTEYYDRESMMRMRQTLEGLDRAYPSAVWLDYSNHTELARTSVYYVDSDHLSDAGARVFSALMGNCLRGLPERGPECGRNFHTGAGGHRRSAVHE